MPVNLQSTLQSTAERRHSIAELSNAPLHMKQDNTSLIIITPTLTLTLSLPPKIIKKHSPPTYLDAKVNFHVSLFGLRSPDFHLILFLITLVVSICYVYHLFL